MPWMSVVPQFLLGITHLCSMSSSARRATSSIKSLLSNVDKPQVAGTRLQIPHRQLRLPRQTSGASCQPMRRSFASTSSEPPEYRSRTLITFNQAVGAAAFVGAIVLAKAVYVYDWLYASAIWPEAVRDPLRRALKARHRGNLEEAERYYKAAIRAANALAPAALDPDPLSKLTGLYIAFAGLYEEVGRPVRAYEQYRLALGHLGEALATEPGRRKAGKWAGERAISAEDHIRAIGLHQKMGQVALQIGLSPTARPFPVEGSAGPSSWLDAAEQHLTVAVNAMLRLGLDKKAIGSGKQIISGRDVQLPEGERMGESTGRVDKHGLGITMASLAEVHANKGEYDLAAQLLLQTLSIVLPPGAKAPSVEDRCRAAQIMTSISTYASHDGSRKSAPVGKSWSLRALQIVEQAILDNGGNFDGPAANCIRAQGVGLYNLGVLAEMEGNVKTADELLSRALTVSTEAGFHEGQRQAANALKRLRAAESAAARAS